MRRAKLLELIGIAIGIPGFLLLFVQGKIAVALLVLVVIGVLAWHRWFLQLPNLTIIEIEKIFDFKDAFAHRVLMTRRQRMRVNHPTAEYWFTNISADGSIQEITIDGAPPAEKRSQAGDLMVCKRWNHPLERGQEVTINFCYELIDSFGRNPEGVIHVVAAKAKRVRITVKLHPDRPCLGASSYRRYAGQEYRDLPAPALRDSNRHIELEFEAKKVGTEVEIEWTWDPPR